MVAAVTGSSIWHTEVEVNPEHEQRHAERDGHQRGVRHEAAEQPARQREVEHGEHREGQLHRLQHVEVFVDRVVQVRVVDGRRRHQQRRAERDGARERHALPRRNLDLPTRVTCVIGMSRVAWGFNRVGRAFPTEGCE